MVNRIPLNNQNVQNNPDPQNHNPLPNNNRRVGIGLLNGIGRLVQRVQNGRAQRLNPPADNRQAQRQGVNLAGIHEAGQNVENDPEILDPLINNRGQQAAEDLQRLMAAVNADAQGANRHRRIPLVYFVPIVGPIIQLVREINHYRREANEDQEFRNAYQFILPAINPDVMTNTTTLS
jgi:hypothetical protein